MYISKKTIYKSTNYTVEKIVSKYLGIKYRVTHTRDNEFICCKICDSAKHAVLTIKKHKHLIQGLGFSCNM
jgi:hypothetical protein